eukprot:GSMAST32.ASY1.ANO1.2090.1 assembled CDS
MTAHRKLRAGGKRDVRDIKNESTANTVNPSSIEKEKINRRLEEARATVRIPRRPPPKRTLRFNDKFAGADGRQAAFSQRHEKHKAFGNARRAKEVVKKKKKDRDYQRAQVQTFDDWLSVSKSGKKGRKVQYFDGIPLRDLAAAMRVQIRHLQNAFFELGEIKLSKAKSTHDNIPADIAELVIAEFGMTPIVSSAPQDVFNEDFLDLTPTPQRSELPDRPPVVAVMGHVNHGKTSLLDSLRKRHHIHNSVVKDENETGNITQAMSAFAVELGGRKRGAFIDTPGHAAFSKMRERGVMITDIALVVVDAVQGLQRQTNETIQLLAQQIPPTPVVLALNKCDLLEPHELEEARKKVSSQIMNLGFMTEEDGGDVQMVEVSAKENTGLESLEEAILLSAEIMELRAAREGRGEAVVLEAKVTPGIGPSITAMVTCGTINEGDYFVCGTKWGRVRQLNCCKGMSLEQAYASTPIQIVGINDTVAAGDELICADDEEHAKSIANAHQLILSKSKELGRKLRPNAASSIGNDKDSNISPLDPNISSVSLILKADTDGALETLKAEIMSIPQHKLNVRIVQSGVGTVTKNDLFKADTYGAAIFGFNTKTPKVIRDTADEEQINIYEDPIIYSVVDQVKEFMIDSLPPIIEEKMLGQARILQTFDITKRGRRTFEVAGVKVVSGEIKRSNKMRLLRGKNVIFEAPYLSSLQHFKEKVNVIKQGSECALSLHGWEERTEGDILQSFENVATKQTLV